MKYGIDIGHNCPPDTGAVGIKSEDALVTDVGNRAMSKLKALGHEVISCTPNKASSVNNSLSQRCDKANSDKVDIYVSIHFNAFNGQANGTEVFAASDNGRKIAQPVLNEIVNLGFANRRVKDGSHLFVLRNTNMPAILIECCFIDSQKDMDLFDPEAMANAIVKGLTGKSPTVPLETFSRKMLLNDLAGEYLSTDLADILTKVGIDAEISSANLQLLKQTTLAQWLLESGRATSKLAIEANNFAGLKWRDPDMKGFAEPLTIKVPSETTEVVFCKFTSIEGFIAGYWRFLSRSPYKGLEGYTNTPESFIGFLKSKGYSTDPGYVEKVMSLLPEAQKLLLG